MGKITSFKQLVISTIVALILFLSITVSAQSFQDDEIKDLPGLTFNPTFKQYSGFLPTSTGSNLHYWLVEAQQNPSTSPLVVWLNGGPGCSSLSGLFQENGPFQVNPDAATLIENQYSWNKIGNILYLESPRDVGFSYGTPANIMHTDNLTRDDNAEAITKFIQRFPHYSGRDFYITGESYGGVYVPTLSQKIVELISSNNLNLTFKGFAVGNGILSNSRQVDSYVDLSYYRGVIGKQQFDYLKSCCPYPLEPAQVCNYTATYLDFDYTSGFYGPKNSTDPKFLACATAIMNIGQNNMWESELYADVYNFIQSCYTTSEGFKEGLLKDYIKTERVRSMLSKFTDSPIVSDGYSSFIDQGAKINTKSTDPFAGYRCYSGDAMIKYLNREDVKTAINIPKTSAAWNISWTDCADEGAFQYLRQYPEMDGVFRSLLNAQNPLRILVYNGDTDSVCNYLGDQWFVEDLNLPSVSDRVNWHFTYQPGSTISEVAGSQQRFSMYNTSSYIDLVTIKGSGHMVPTDRPGQSLQMLANFIYGSYSYDTPANVSLTLQPLKDQFKNDEPILTRKELDKVYSLPGLTFPINFENYAGYLKASKGNYLHYWMVTSQTSPGSDPLFLWLTGGPGCSGLGALLTELGPFRPNPDNRTLHENVFSWNKFANILFLESPRGVGFSFQNKTENPDTRWDDDRSANDAYLALKDFFSVYTEFQNRPFYIIGESYGGVYVPMLTSLLIEKIQSGDIKNVNLVGMAVGNGELNSIIGGNSLLSDMYYHGYIGTGEWAILAQCCNTTYQMLPFCPFDARYTVSPDGEAIPKDPNSACDKLIADKINNVWTEDMLYYSDVYNQNQDCYQQTSYLLGSVRSAKTRRKVVEHTRKFIKQQKDASVTNYVDAYRYNNDNYNPISTDQLGGFPCFGTDAAADYLNQPEVRKALHVPDSNRNPWGFCNDDVNYQYVRQYNDTGIFFDRILTSQYPMKILIYNGDTDYACNFMGDQWFVEGIASKWSLATTKPYKEWIFRNQIAGYAKQFASQHVTINLVTVKGAGHMVPMDRPGPAMQLMSNFFNDKDFSSAVIYSSENTPLKQQYRVQEMLTNITITQKTSASRKAKAILRSNNKEEPRVKREARADPPPPPPGSKATDKVTGLPGVTFQQTNHYSGYLEAHTGVFLHYWLIETPFNQTTAPLILWLNGGPGCSSLGGLINELGPIRPSKDASSLLENPFAWTKAGNVFFLESPRGVGFSYSSGAEVPADAPYNDTYTAENNVLAIKTFFSRYPEYQNREFYITGESYGGVYIPTLTDALIKTIKNENINYINFKGIAIGNGEMSEVLQISSAVNLLYYRGTYDYPTFMEISACCPGNTQQIPGYLTPCDFTQYITLDDYGNAHGIQSDNSTIYKCGQLVEKYGFEYVWETLNDVYNTYQDCYNPPYNNTGLAKEKVVKRSKRSADIASKPGQLLANKFDFVDMAKLLTKDSTDPFRGVYCYQDDASVGYLRRQDVREALHVNIAGLPPWTDCNDDINANYHQLHHDTTPVFDSILASNWPLRILIYNGDADMACQFKGDEWFIERLAYNYNMPATQERKPWYYKYVDGTGFDWDPRVAGFQKKFRGRHVNIDLLTIKGGGHLVPLDRPAPTLQMIYNFIYQKDYDTALPYSLIKPQDLFPNSTVAPIPYNNETYRVASRVYDLPGLTFNPTFASHSGYLTGSKLGSYIHYWFTESQNDPSQDPVVFWFTGDFGCSSVAGMLSEMGPFRPNPDGQTLYENVFSWNKQASMIFLEVPRGVGFSYQDWGDDKDTSFPDDQNADDAVSAIINWLTIYSSFASRDIYIGGENYGGVLIPLIAKSIGAKIDSGMQPLNNIKFRGILIGNGRLSNKWNLAHRGDFMYFHGQLSKEDWTTYRGCCQPQNQTYCNITAYLLPNGDSNGINATCGSIASFIARQRMHRSSLHLYNMYQDCYGFQSESFGHSAFHVAENNKFFKNHRFNAKAAFVSQFSRMNFKSTDSNGGFQCYMVDAVTQYLNQRSVRDALNVPDYVHQFEYCNDSISYLHTPSYDNDYVNDMSSTFIDLFNSNFIKNGDKTNPFRVMLYNGDVDLDVTILEAEYFAESLVQTLGAELRLNRTNWNYQRPGPNSRSRVGGYVKNWYFRSQNVHLDLVTVKGAGTFVAVDRPGPALQMFVNFINNNETGSPVMLSLDRQPLKAQYQTPASLPDIPTIPTASTPPSTSPNTDSTTPFTGSTTTGPTPPTPVTDGSSTSPASTSSYTGSPTTPTTTTTTTATPATVPTTTTTAAVATTTPSNTSSSVSPTSSNITTTTNENKDGGASAASLSLLTIFVSIFSTLFLAQRFEL